MKGFVLVLRDKTGYLIERFASDSGLIPYVYEGTKGVHWNETNYMVPSEETKKKIYGEVDSEPIGYIIETVETRTVTENVLPVYEG